MFTVTKEFSFEAAHSLPHLPEGHKCRNLHGHSYKVVVGCESPTFDGRGFVVDYAEISEAMEPTLKLLDHKNLNDIISQQTTAEVLSWWTFQQLKETKIGKTLAFVEVRETEKTSVIYKP